MRADLLEPPRLWRRFTAAVDSRWPELADSAVLAPPVPFRAAMLLIVLVFLGLQVISSLMGQAWLSGQALSFTLIVIFLPLICVWINRGLCVVALTVAYAMVLLSQQPIAVVAPAIICCVILCMWNRWGVGMLLMLAQLTAALSLVGLGDTVTIRMQAFLLAFMIFAGSAVGWTIRFFRCRARLTQLRVAQLETEVAGVRSAERRDLARELHDLVAHDVTATALRANAGLLSGEPQVQRRVLQDIADGASGTIEDLRRMVSALQEEAGEATALDDGIAPQHQALRTDQTGAQRPTAPTDSMETALDRCRQLLEDAGFDRVEIARGDGWEEIATSVRSLCQRVLREGTANAIRHGIPSAPVSLSASLETTPQGRSIAVIRVRNLVRDARSRSARLPREIFLEGGLGLVGLSERVDIFGGELSFGRQLDTWELMARIPLQEADRRA